MYTKYLKNKPVTSSRLILTALLCASLLLVGFSSMPQPIQPATGTVINVTILKDVRANDGKCSLREAVIAANTNLRSGSKPGECPAGKGDLMDSIVLAPGATYALTLNSSFEDYARNGDLDIRNNLAATDLTIRVRLNGTATIWQNAVVDDRVLDIFGAKVIIKGVTFAGGGNVGSGGGIRNLGNLTLVACRVRGNSVDWTGGGIFNSNKGLLRVTSSTISGNSSKVHGGGIMNEGTLILAKGIVSNNSAAPNGGSGGGIANSGHLTIDASIISANSSGQLAGGLGNWPGGTTTIRNGSVIGGDPSKGKGNTASEQGGGIVNEGTLTMVDSAISGNAAEHGGGISNWSTGKLNLVRSTISANSANDGGGVANSEGTTTLTNTNVSQNTAAWGGGIFTEGGKLILNASTVANNTASVGDGGIQIREGAIVVIKNGSVISGNSAPNGYGGGVSNWNSTLTIDASSITGNSAAESAGGVLNKDGGTTTIQNGSVISGNTAKYEGGVSNWGGSTLTVDGSFISGNTASGSSGGIGNLGTMTLNASTVSGNTAPWGGGLFNAPGASMTVSLSTISGNSAPGGGGGLLNVNGTLTVTGSALLSNTSDGNGDAVYSTTEAVNATSVTSSCISGNGDTAVFNEKSASQNFASNWWDAATGPSGVGPGSGDSVSEFIDFSGWLAAPPAICAP